MMTLDVDDDVERKGRGIIAPRQAFTGLGLEGNVLDRSYEAARSGRK